MKKLSQSPRPSLDDDVDPLFLVALIQLELSGVRIGGGGKALSKSKVY